MRIAICLLLGLLLFDARAFATVEGWEIAGDPSRVAINYSSNHGYYPRNWPYAFRYQVAALEAVRRDLVLKGKLENEPILIRIPDAGFTSNPGRTRLSLETVALQRGDSEAVLGARRYVIEWNDAARREPTTREFYEGLLHLALSLQKLNVKKRNLMVSDWPRLRREYSSQAAIYKNIVQYFDPIWSPDDRFLIFTSWQNGRADFQILDRARRVLWKLESLQGVQSCRPLWSDDGHYVAYADLKTVKIFRTGNAQTQSLALPFADKNNVHEILLDFRSRYEKDKQRNSLMIAGDTNLFNEYAVLNYDPTRRQLRDRYVLPGRPEWEGNARDQEQIFESRRADSFSGYWISAIEENRGLRRLIVRSSESPEYIRVTDLQIKIAPSSQAITIPPARTPSTSLRAAPQTGKPPIRALPQPISPQPAPRGQFALLVACSAVLAGLAFFLFRFLKRIKS